MRQMDLGGAQAVTSFAILSALSMYREAVPPINELRNAPPNDVLLKQRIIDADVYGAISVLLIGGTAAVLSRDPLPFMLGALGLGLISFYHRSLLDSPSTIRYEGTPNKGS